MMALALPVSASASASASASTTSSAFFSRVETRITRLYPTRQSWHFRNSRRHGLNIFASSGPTEISSFGGIPENSSQGEAKPPPTYTWHDNKRPRVCILGGGFGGLYTALRLESLVWPDNKKPQVVLVDQSDRFVFKPMLYELLSGEVDVWEIAPRFKELLANTSVQFLKDRVKCLLPYDDNSGGSVHLQSGLQIEYDWLVLALGAESKLDIVPGAIEYALPFSTLEDANKVNEKLRSLERENFVKSVPIRVAIVGCGYSGIELAATISERLHNKGVIQAINIDKTILPNAPLGNREAALKVISSRKVELLLGYFVKCVRRGECESVILELQSNERGLESQILEVDIVLWTVGTKVVISELEGSYNSNKNNNKPFELPLNGRGQAETDETLRVKGHPRIFAVGDSSALRDSNGKLLPTTAQVAFQEADFAGWNLWAAINDRPLLPFRFQNLGEMMTLGRYDAAISPSFIDGLTLEGPIGHTARKIAYLLRLPTDEHRVKVGISWLAKSAVDSIVLLQNTVTKVLSE